MYAEVESPASAYAANLSTARATRKTGHSRRPWLPQDKRQLAGMKGKNWSIERIARVLGRSDGAVAQQWRM